MTEPAPPPVQGLLDVLREAVEGGRPGHGTAFVDGTKADGSGNHGLLATLDHLSAAQASQSVLGTTIAAHAAHTAYHLEVIIRWERDGDRGPFDWPGSFQPAQVDEAAWTEQRRRLRAAYNEVLHFVETQRDQPLTEDLLGGLSGAVAHVAYHLGAIRQLLKGAQ
ncbi:DinB family protein [Deinococcus taeanensis]|uniref:DinB family protein n=1 Tax=Deinococcus taeanensis TaxID=2737050 RepID=UPI001CDD838F|nr:DinB family protein [Deinococcus taeanensis]UBV42549.1 DinB family protein [Deinococcus taeanensis]